MLSEIEQLILGGNQAHDLISLEKDSAKWIIKASPSYDCKIVKVFEFNDVKEKYEQFLLDAGEEVEYPLPIIGFDSSKLPNNLWRFCLNASAMEWGFIAKWPIKL